MEYNASLSVKHREFWRYVFGFRFVLASQLK